MKGDSTATTACPGCGSASFTSDSQGVPACEYCGSAYSPPEGKCPGCGAAYETGSRRCSICATQLVRECPACETLNPLGAPHCLVCQRPLDLVDAMFDRLTKSTFDQLRQVRRAGVRLKAREQAASRARSERMWADEDRRHRELAQAQAERERQERLIVTIAVGVVAVVVVIAIIIAIIATAGASDASYYGWLSAPGSALSEPAPGPANARGGPPMIVMHHF